MIVTLRNLFVPDAIANTMETLPVLQTTVMDTFFKARPSHPSPMIGRSVIEDIVQTIPVVRRDGLPIPLANEAMETDFIAPLPIKPSINISAAEVNDMRAWLGNTQTLENWRKKKIDVLRRVVRDSTEGMCSTVFNTGKVEWPIHHEGGRKETYSIDFGTIPTYTPKAAIGVNSKLSDVYGILEDMEEIIRRNGFGGKVEFWAGKKVFRQLIDLAEASVTTLAINPFKIAFKDGKVEIGDYVIHALKEHYPSPMGDGTWVPKIGEKELHAVAIDIGGSVHYCAIDNIKANNAPTPFHITVVERADGSGISLIAQSKPLPARPSKASCKCQAVE